MCLKLPSTELFVFIDGLVVFGFACFDVMFERLISHFIHKLFVYGFQLEHQELDVLLRLCHFVIQFVQFVCQFIENCNLNFVCPFYL